MSPNARGWENFFLVDVRITGSIFETKSSSLVAPGVDPSLISASFFLGVLGERLVVGFLGGFFLSLARN
jgi:hypothetical protein